MYHIKKMSNLQRKTNLKYRYNILVLQNAPVYPSVQLHDGVSSSIQMPCCPQGFVRHLSTSVI